MLAQTNLPQRSLFVLSGDNSTIPKGELDALIKIYSNNSEICMVDSRVALVDGNLDPTLITRRAAYIRLGGTYIGSVVHPCEEDFQRLDFSKIVKFKSFAARTYNLSGGIINKDIAANLGHIIKETIPSAKVSLEKPDILVVVIACKTGYHVCGVDTTSTHKFWYYRRPRIRPFFHPSVLYPKLARLLVNLTHIKENELLLDPFCGTGSILIEAGLIGVNSLGIDISRRMCSGALKNLKHFNILSSDIVNCDAFYLPIKQVDGVATDIPYGRSASTYTRKVDFIASELLNNLETLLSVGRYACVIHPHYVNMPESSLFEQVQEHNIYIHRQLTRTITLLKRI